MGSQVVMTVNFGPYRKGKLYILDHFLYSKYRSQSKAGYHIFELVLTPTTMDPTELSPEDIRISLGTGMDVFGLVRAGIAKSILNY